MEHVLRRAWGLLLVAYALLFAGGCGNATPPSQPGTELPTPTPAPTPTSAGFLHVLQQPYAMTYDIDAATGRLHPPITQHIGDAYMLAGDPQGRRVYTAHGHGICGGSHDLTLVALVPDPVDGTLRRVSEVDVGGARWTWFAAGPDRVHALVWYMAGSCSLPSFSYLSVPVAIDGVLGEYNGQGFPYETDRGFVTVDVRSDMLYKAGRVLGGLGGLAAHAIQPNGTLKQTGWTDLCVATAMPPFSMETPEDEVPIPLVALRGFLFAAVSLPPDRRTVCSYQGPRLKPLANLGFQAYVAEAYVPASESQPALLAMGVEIPAGRTTRNELRLFSMNADGALHLLDSEELLRDVATLVFHPSGRFLYVSDTADTLLGFQIDTEGRLELVVSIDHAGGGMAITIPQAGT